MSCWKKKGRIRLTLLKKAEAFAPAKVNLTLHVTGQRADGYHLLDSLVVFVGAGDWLRGMLTDGASFDVTGPRAAGVPTDARNLVLKAAALFDPPVPAALVLDKHLPAAAGIGGGSSDAAACLRLLAHLGGRDLPEADRVLQLGADVPVCLAGDPLRMRGIGEVLEPLPRLPRMWMVLVNPGVDVPTPAVFRGLAQKTNSPMPDIPAFASAAEMMAWLSDQRNDLEPPARAVAPVISDVVSALAAQPGCGLARMSGSGATCFGLFEQAVDAEKAAADLATAHPDWWVQDAPVLGRAPDQLIRATT